MNKPRLLYITPAVPSRTGNGPSMRAYSVLKALSSQYAVYLLVVSTLFKNHSLDRDVSEMCQDVAHLPLGLGMEFSLTARLLAQKIAPRLFTKHWSHPMEWLYITPKRLKSVAQMFRGIQFDVIHVFRLYMAPYAFLFSGENFSGVCQLDLDDIESLTRERLSGLFALNGDAEMSSRMSSEATKYKDIEKSMLSGFARVFVCSSLDQEKLCQRHQCRRVEVIPNVVQIPEEETEESVSTPFNFLFVGSLGYYPNSEGIIYFCKKVLPLLRRKANSEFVVTIVGDGISRKDARSLSRIKVVNLIGWVEDVSPYYRNAHSVIIPLRAGGGTRVKAIEAFAYKKPVVSTTIGVEGIDVQHEKHVLIADTEYIFAESCLRIMTDPALRKRLVDNAFLLVTEFHNMELIKEYDSIFLKN
jgi:polysaccharide biosynthesis protein PslH